MSRPYHVTPRDQGQVVTVSYCDAGEAGCIRRVFDASDRSVVYTLHRWRVGGVFEPWNGRVDIWARGRRITAAEVEVLERGE